MFTNLKKRIHASLLRTAFFRRVLSVLERTPRHAVHWYVILALGFLVASITIILAWVAFSGVTREHGEQFENIGGAVTIQRFELNKALETARMREAEFEQLKHVTPPVIDPGR